MIVKGGNLIGEMLSHRLYRVVRGYCGDMRITVNIRASIIKLGIANLVGVKVSRTQYKKCREKTGKTLLAQKSSTIFI